MKDKLQEYAMNRAEELRGAEAELATQIHALEQAVQPLIARLNRLKHRKTWLTEARDKMEELARACKSSDDDEIPF